MYDVNAPTQNAPRHAPQYRTYYARHDVDGPAEYSTTVVHALADVLGVDISEAGAELYDAVDPDALNLLFRHREDGRRTPGHVCFQVWDCYVTAYADGEIVVETPVDESTPPTDPAPR